MKCYKTLCFALLVVLAPAGVAHASGTLIPNNPNIVRPPGSSVFSVQSQHVNVDIDRQVAATSIEQVFQNNTGRVLEATYLYPIPEDVSISSFSMWMNGQEVKGQIVDSRQARRVYQNIVRRTRDPGLLEYVGQNLFQARVYPVPANGEVRIRIEYDELLRYDTGLVGYRYPLKADGYGFGNIGEVSVGVEIKSDVPINSLYSPTHDIDFKIAGQEAYCSFESKDATPDSDFQLYYTVSEADVGMNLLTHRLEKDAGYFMLLLAPGSFVDKDKIIPKDIVFVIDRSGSMKGEKIAQAKNALKYCISWLNDDDRFNIITFSTGIDRFETNLAGATKINRHNAKRFVDAVEARGGTDINEALLAAFDLPQSDRPQMIVFLTDGQPTVGVTHPHAIVANLMAENRQRVRVFSFGVGYDVNTNLLDRITSDHRGSVEYVKPDESIESKVSNFYDKVSNPVLSDIKLTFGKARVLDVYPSELPDIFEGSQLVVTGRYRGHGPAKITLTGNVEKSSRRFEYEARFPNRETGQPFIPRLWAGRKIAYLLSEIKTNGHNSELVDEITTLSVEHGIITPYTSYLVLEEGSQHLIGSTGRSPTGDHALMTRTQAITITEDRIPLDVTTSSTRAVSSKQLTEMPVDELLERVALKGGTVKTGDEMHVRGGRSGEIQTQIDGVPVDDPLGNKKQKSAFDKSRYLSEVKRDNVAPSSTGQKFRYTGGKTFVRTPEGWKDLAYKDGMDVTEVEYLSEAYFALLKEYPDVKKYLALGEQVTFVYKDKAYRIVKPKE